MRSSVLEASSTFARIPGAKLIGPSRVLGAPAISHAVYRLDGVELRVVHGELLANALDVRRDRAFVDDHVRVAHELVARLDVAGQLRERMDDPEFGDGELDRRLVPPRCH